jgi:hypothetical protein
MAENTRGSSATQFLNVDLDIYSRSDLRPLIDGFGRKVTVMYAGKLKGKYCAHLEVAKYTRNADATIRAFCKLIEALPDDLRARWNAATVRSFSIGIQAGTHPNSSDFVVGPKTVKAVSDVAAQIVLTVYAPEQFRK